MMWRPAGGERLDPGDGLESTARGISHLFRSRRTRGTCKIKETVEPARQRKIGRLNRAATVLQPEQYGAEPVRLFAHDLKGRKPLR